MAQLPGGRGDGQPVTTLIELEAGTQIAHYFAGPASTQLLLSSSGGYGFLAQIDNLVARNKGGKAFITLADGETVCPPALVAEATHVACVSANGRLLTFELSELKTLERGGRGLMLLALEAPDRLVGAAAYSRSVRIMGVGRGSKPREELLEWRSLHNAQAPRGRKGKEVNFGFKPASVLRHQ